MSDGNSTDPVVLCSFPRCMKKRKYKDGLCNSHREQRRNGHSLTPLYSDQRKAGSPPRIICDEAPCPVPDLIGPCHVFRGGKDGKGYGVTTYKGRHIGVHVYIFEMEKGSSVEDGLEVDHICRNPGCCNTDHLREVTHKVNTTENIVGASWQLQMARTHCPKGHEYTEANTYHNPKKPGRGCKICRVEANRRFVAKQRSLEKSLR